MSNNYCVFILSYKRPKNIPTLDSLKKAGFKGKYYIVVDDTDRELETYKKIHGESLLIFNKKEMLKTTDVGDNFENMNLVVFARNACFNLAKELNYDYFIQLDDDYIRFSYAGNHEEDYITKHMKIKDINKIFDLMIDFVRDTPTLTLAMAQGGDFIGGPSSSVWKNRLARKAMNTFVCSTKKPFSFFGGINEDVNTYVELGRQGKLFFTLALLRMEQLRTQSNEGGLTEIYLEQGTYVKSFYSIMYAPSCVEIRSMGVVTRRLHHFVNWDATAPKILHEKHKKA